MNDVSLQRCWRDAVVSLVPADATDSIVLCVWQILLLKMLHSQFKEYITGRRLLETLKEGKTADIDVALRAKLKTHATAKHTCISSHPM